MSKEKKLKHLRRSELIEIIYLLKKNEQMLTERIEELQAQLQEQNMKMADVGSIAEASLALTDIFTKAQEAADIYLDAIKRKQDEAEKISAQIIANAMEKSEKIIHSTDQKSE